MREYLGWRIGTTLLLLTIIALPILGPVTQSFLHPSAWATWNEAARMAGLALNTFLLVLGTLALAFPLGVLAALLLYRTDLPGRGAFRFLAVLTLFVPLPLFASGWQATFGASGWLPWTWWNPWSADGPLWTPWGQGLVSAIWIHAAAGLPWVVVLAGQGLRWVERDLEEEALLSASPWQVVFRVTLPRSRAALFAAALWLTLLAATEVTVTDMMQVRTFAEEVYTQFVKSEPVSLSDTREIILARAVAVSLPGTLLTVGLVLAAGLYWERTLPPLAQRHSPRDFALGPWRWPAALLAGFVCASLLGVPLASLIWKAGQQPGFLPAWSAATLMVHLRTVIIAHSGTVAASAATALATGAITASLALLGCWLATGSRAMTGVVLTLAAVSLAVPGPIIGVGLTPLGRWLADVTGSDLVGRLFYFGPSYLPPGWACTVRFFGCAVVVLWPVVRMLPRDLRESARVDGASASQEFRHLIWPMTGLAWLFAAWVVAALSLGELAASKIVATAGAPMLAHEVFGLMHTGVTNDLAALCLVLLATAAGAGGVVALIRRRLN